MRSAAVLRRAMAALAVLTVSMATLMLLPPGAGGVRAQAEAIELDVPRVVLRGVPFTVTAKDPTGTLAEGTQLTLRAGEDTYEATSAGAETAIEDVVVTDETSVELVDATGATLARAAVEPIPGWFAILPALVAIVVALTLRQVIGRPSSVPSWTECEYIETPAANSPALSSSAWTVTPCSDSHT